MLRGESLQRGRAPLWKQNLRNPQARVGLSSAQFLVFAWTWDNEHHGQDSGWVFVISYSVFPRPVLMSLSTGLTGRRHSDQL
jgi:hypothetical protein